MKFARSHALIVVLLLLVAGALLLPSILLSEWPSLDAGGILRISTTWPESLSWIVSPYNGSGRYFPIYWLYHVALYQTFGLHLAAFMTAQAVIFFLSMALACTWFFRMTKSFGYSALLALFLLANTPNVENLYTLGKAEPLAFALMLPVLMILHAAAGWSLRSRIIGGAAASVLFAMAMWTKETSLVLLALVPLGAIFSLYLDRSAAPAQGTRKILRRYTLPLACLAGGLLLCRVPYWIYPSTSTRKNYTSYTLDLQTAIDNLAFYIIQQPDVIAFGLLTFALFVLILRKLRTAEGLAASQSRDLVLMASLWCMGAAYYAVLVLWRWPMAYYPYFPSIAFKLSCLYALWMLDRRGRLGRLLRGTVVATFACALAYSALYAYYMANSQIAFSRAYNEAISTYVAKAAPGERLVIESYPFFAEQTGNTIQLIAALYGRTLPVSAVGDVVNPAMVVPSMMQLLNVTPEDVARNENKLPKPGDFLLVMTGNKLATWFLRSVTPYFSEDSILHKEDAYAMELVGEDKFYATSPFVNVWTHEINLRPTYLGYKLYRVTSKPKRTWTGRFPDGWIGKNAVIKLYGSYEKSLSITVSTLHYNVPAQFSMRCGDGFEQNVQLTDEGPHVIKYDRRPSDQPSDQPDVCRLEVSSTFVPKKVGLNQDKRELGAVVQITPTP